MAIPDHDPIPENIYVLATDTDLDRAVNNDANNSKFYGCYNELSHAYPELPLVGVLKDRPEDFVVEELLGFSLSGAGEHHYLCIQKSNLNTTDVAEKLAAYSKSSVRDVSYSGLKDKRAQTTQWFSVQLPGRRLEELDWSGIETLDWRTGSVTLLNASLHSRKLRRGAHSANNFRIRLRNIDTVNNEPESVSLHEDLAKKVADRANTIAQYGFPNYFGEQRFGFNGSNLDKAIIELNRKRKLSRSKKSLYLSSVRSYLFNRVLSARVAEQSWNQYRQNDRLVLEGTNSFFTLNEDSDTETSSTNARLAQGDIHIGGLLPGDTSRRSKNGDTLLLTALEQSVYQEYPEFIGLLDRHRLDATVRPSRAIPKHLKVTFSGESLELRFSLPSGSFATSLLREFGRFKVNY